MNGDTVRPGSNGIGSDGNLTTTDRFLEHTVTVVRITENLSTAFQREAAQDF